MSGYRFFKDDSHKNKEALRATGSRIMFVEGLDECLMFDRMLAELNADENSVQIIAYNGKEKFSVNLSALLKQPAFIAGNVRSFAVFQDADNDYEGTKMLIQNAMQAEGLRDSTIGNFIESRKYVGLYHGIYIFPDNRGKGNLETLLMRTVNDKDDAIGAVAYVDKYVTQGDTAKRKCQVYLSVQAELCRGAGLGARKNYFPLKSDELHHVRLFIKQFLAI